MAELDDSLTASEIVSELAQQEEEADIILGGDDGTECTYAKGYVPRQAVFSCLTCTPDGTAGICLACSLKCHDEHEVVEIYTRRNFRCDCGNSKFSSTCRLIPDKEPANDANCYNHNYRGVYCTCNRPYPDPDLEGEEEQMFQCVVCEDWFHDSHLGLKDGELAPSADDDGFDELVCTGCATSRCHFLAAYGHLMVPPVKDSTGDAPAAAIIAAALAGAASPQPHLAAVTLGKAAKADASPPAAPSDSNASPGTGIDAVTTSSSILLSGSSSSPFTTQPLVAASLTTRPGDSESLASAPLGQSDVASPRKGQSDVVLAPTHQSGSLSSAPTGQSESLDSAPPGTLASAPAGQSDSLDSAPPGQSDGLASTPLGPSDLASTHSDQSCFACIRPGAKEPVHLTAALFFKVGWREALCRCSDCLAEYERAGVEFLLDKGDTVAEYERLAKEKRVGQPSVEDRAAEVFQQRLSPMQQVTMLHEFNDLTTGLHHFLVPFAQSGIPVTSQAIREFFEDLRAKKRRKVY